MRHFSIMIPSRERVESLERLLLSLQDTMKYPTKSEIIITIDYCDPKISEYHKMVDDNNFAIDLVIYERSRSDNLSHDYYNWMAKRSCGKILWVLNDDCEVITKDWDHHVMTTVNTWRTHTHFRDHSDPGFIWYGDVKDSTRNYNNNGEFSCFPMMSREAYEALGYFFHPGILTWGADKFLKQAFVMADAVIPLECVEVLHHMHEGYEANDEAHNHMKRVFESQHGAEARINLSPDVARLVEAKKKCYI